MQRLILTLGIPLVVALALWLGHSDEVPRASDTEHDESGMVDVSAGLQGRGAEENDRNTAEAQVSEAGTARPWVGDPRALRAPQVEIRSTDGDRLVGLALGSAPNWAFRGPAFAHPWYGPLRDAERVRVVAPAGFSLDLELPLEGPTKEGGAWRITVPNEALIRGTLVDRQGVPLAWQLAALVRSEAFHILPATDGDAAASRAQWVMPQQGQWALTDAAGRFAFAGAEDGGSYTLLLPGYLWIRAGTVTTVPLHASGIVASSKRQRVVLAAPRVPLRIVDAGTGALVPEALVEAVQDGRRRRLASCPEAFRAHASWSHVLMIPHTASLRTYRCIVRVSALGYLDSEVELADFVEQQDIQPRTLELVPDRSASRLDLHLEVPASVDAREVRTAVRVRQDDPLERRAQLELLEAAAQKNDVAAADLIAQRAELLATRDRWARVSHDGTTWEGDVRGTNMKILPLREGLAHVHVAPRRDPEDTSPASFLLGGQISVPVKRGRTATASLPLRLGGAGLFDLAEVECPWNGNARISCILFRERSPGVWGRDDQAAWSLKHPKGTWHAADLEVGLPAENVRYIGTGLLEPGNYQIVFRVREDASPSGPPTMSPWIHARAFTIEAGKLHRSTSRLRRGEAVPPPPLKDTAPVGGCGHSCGASCG